MLVTLLLCNAAAMEALPLSLDKLLPAYAAIIVSVTGVLFFGEIIP
jgi:metal transporter CNNM